MIRAILAVAMFCFMIIAFMYAMGEAAGQQCDWVSDCGFNETCRTVPFSQRGPNDQPGICVPKSWGE